MTEKPTLSSVAKAAGVSVPTVSQVMRGTGRISEETRDKVMRAAKQLHYVPNSRAASMRSGENREVGFVINRFANPFNAEVLSGALDLLEAEGYLVSILDTRDDAARQAQQLETFIGSGRGGLIWVPAAETTDETLGLLRTHRVPTVTFMRQISDDFDHVGIQNRDATGIATAHLVSLGHRRIAFLGGTEMTSVRQERIAGYKDALARVGQADPVIWPSHDTKRAGRDAIKALLQDHPDVTAVVCNGDIVALGACLGLAELGLQPGRDVSVLGFDDIDDASMAMPRLSTMSVAPKSLGATLARTLLKRLADPMAAVMVSQLPATFVERETTGRGPSAAF